MRKLLLFVAICFNTIYLNHLNAQEYKPNTLKNGIISGDIKALDNIKELNFFYDYSTMIIGDGVLGKGNYVKEEEFLDKKCKAEEETGPGKGQEFREKWGKWITMDNAAEFQMLFNKWAGNRINMSGVNNGVAYDNTLTIKVAKVAMGYPISMDAFFVFTDKNGKELVTIFLRDLAGSPKALYHAFGKAAKEIIDTIEILRNKAQ